MVVIYMLLWSKSEHFNKKKTKLDSFSNMLQPCSTQHDRHANNILTKDSFKLHLSTSIKLYDLHINFVK
jgi:hypothetical protein